jgi:glyoxylase-like metal-dependent hydrolase (beta-lactamase superfamily II)
MHPDHLLGHGAFTALHPEFVAAARQRAALAARAEGYLRRQHDSLAALAEGSIVVLPDHPVEGRAMLDLGGRELELRTWRTAHTDNDLTVQDLATGTLFTGDLLFREHLPVVDGSLRGWLQVLPELQKLASAVVVPGHGPVASPQESGAAFARERSYLAALSAEVRAALKRNATLADTVAATVPPSDWALVDLYHRRNVTSAFAELEWDD